jgi:hypothetical protein
MKKSALIATAMVVGLGGFTAVGANAGPFIPMTVQGDHGAPIIYVGGKKKKKFARQLSQQLIIGVLKSTPQGQEGELANCLEAAGAEGLGPKAALRACMETLGTGADDGESSEEM